MKRHFRFLFLFLAPAVCGSAAVPPPEKILPADTLVVLTVPDYAKASATWKKWPSSQLWNDPSMKPFKDKFVNKFQSDAVAPLEKELGIKFSDYTGLVQGQFTVALTPPKAGGKGTPTPGLLILADTKEKSAALKTNLASLKSKWVESGKQIRQEKIREVDFSVLIFKKGDLKKTLQKAFPNAREDNDQAEPGEGKGNENIELVIGQSGSLLIVATSLGDVEKALINQSGGATATLSEQGSFASSYGSHFRDAQMFGWVNVASILDLFLKASSKESNDDAAGQPQGMPKPEKLLAAVGLTGLQSLALGVRDPGDGCMATLSVNVPESNRRGIFKVLSHDAKDASPPPFVPSDAVKFSRWRLDLPKAWNTLESTLAAAHPQAAGVVKFLIDSAGKEKDPDFDLRKSLIANLGDDFINYQKAPRKPTLDDLNSPPSLILISSPRAEQAAAAIKALSAIMPTPKVKEREFLGRKVYALNLPKTGSSGKPVDRPLHYTASGGFIAMSTDVAMLEEFMRNGETSPKALRETPGLVDAAQKVGGTGTGLFGYENQTETMRAFFDALKKDSGTLSKLLQNTPLGGRLGAGEENDKLKEWVDFSLLPPFERVSRYFSFNVWAGALAPDGFNFKFFTPNPK